MFSATEDSRFSPLQVSEIDGLTVSVNILHSFAKIDNHLDWEIGKHGVYAKFTVKDHDRPNRKTLTSTFLPSVALDHGWDQQLTLDQLRRKAGIRMSSTCLIESTVIQTYESQVASLHYSDYQHK